MFRLIDETLIERRSCDPCKKSQSPRLTIGFLQTYVPPELSSAIHQICDTPEWCELVRSAPPLHDLKGKAMAVLAIYLDTISTEAGSQEKFGNLYRAFILAA